MSSFYSQKVFHSLPKMKRKRNSRLVEIKHSVAMGCSKAKPTITVNGLANSLPAPGRDPAFVFLLEVITWNGLFSFAVTQGKYIHVLPKLSEQERLISCFSGVSS